MNKEHKNCLLCNSVNLIGFKDYEKHHLAKCVDCGFVFMFRIPSLEDLEKHYKTYTYTNKVISPLTLNSFGVLLNEFEKYRSNDFLLDVGCGKGWFLLEAKKRGWNIRGTEFSKNAVEVCKAKGINAVVGDLKEIDFEGILFDVIVISEVIEHTSNPMEQFQFIYSLLRPGGLLYVTTPNFNCYLRYKYKSNYNIIEYPEHLGYFTKKTLHLALSKSKFSKLKLLSTGVSVSRAEFSSGSQKPSEKVALMDEKLRGIMTQNKFMLLLKSSVNWLLTLTGIGVNLKAYYVKK